ncbi:MAG TPA: hypothetical protein VKG02_13635 [Blastocatellia bacterium]|nr:hypothetical protein [Blastocatellia bacterium]
MNAKRILEKARACDLMIAAFTLLLTPSDRDFQEAADLLCDMTPEDLRTLRATVTRLDSMLDALALDRHLRRDE